jgi:hypothetical protein
VQKTLFSCPERRQLPSPAAANYVLLAAKTAARRSRILPEERGFLRASRISEGRLTTLMELTKLKAKRTKGAPRLARLKCGIFKLLQRPFLAAFWRLEWCISRVQDELANVEAAE